MLNDFREKPKVSIIVPVYKTKSTLGECVESLLKQTLQDIEIILVDDGSPDESGNLCDIYTMDSRVKVIHKENGGLSSARNAGMKIATGEYIGFVDSDDFVDNSMFEKMYIKAKSTNAKVCLCAHYTIDSEGKVAEHFLENMPEIMEREQITEKLILPLIGSDGKKESKALEGFVCRNLYKYSTIADRVFLSEREYFAEDVVFNLEVYKNCDKICCVNECLYYYKYNENSLSNKYRSNVEKMLHNLLVFEKNYLIANGLENGLGRLYLTGIKFLFFSIRNLKKKDCCLSEKEKILTVKKILNNPIYIECLKNADKNTYNWKMHGFVFLCRIKQARILMKLI